MSVAACAELVQRGDPDRFLAAMAAPPAARARLFPLYAFNLEVARAPWVTDEPMIAEMRLQWWRDVVEEIEQGARPRSHEVVQPLADVMREAAIPAKLLDGLVEARRWDIYPEPFANEAAFFSNLDQTGGALMWAAALALGASPGAESAVRDVAKAGALAARFVAVPVLAAKGRHPLPCDALDAVAMLARQGLDWLGRARAARATVPRDIAPALFPAWLAGPLLRQAAREPSRVAEGTLTISEFSRRGRLLLLAMTGRW